MEQIRFNNVTVVVRGYKWERNHSSIVFDHLQLIFHREVLAVCGWSSNMKLLWLGRDFVRFSSYCKIACREIRGPECAASGQEPKERAIINQYWIETETQNLVAAINPVISELTSTPIDEGNFDVHPREAQEIDVLRQLRASVTVVDIKHKLHALTDVAADHQRLILLSSRVVLDDHKSLANQKAGNK